MKVEFSIGALRQIDSILAHVEQESPQGARRIEARIKEAARFIEANPYGGAQTTREGVRRVVLNPFPYVMLYREARGRIIVQRVRHAARRV